MSDHVHLAWFRNLSTGGWISPNAPTKLAEAARPPE